MSLNNLAFSKLQGTGNDFLFLKKDNISSPLSADDVVHLCRRREGVGADGIVIVNKNSEKNYSWTFYNADGGEVDMCGNAARCMTVFVANEYGDKEFSFRTRIGEIRAHNRDVPTVSYQASFQIEKQLPTVCAGRFQNGVLVNTGVPHCVIEVADLSDVLPLEAELQPFIMSEEFGLGGANLTFFSSHSDTLESVTFERGVNNFTLSCGTGAIASAFVYHNRENTKQKFQQSVRVPGGLLTVSYVENTVELSGDAKIVYKGVL